MKKNYFVFQFLLLPFVSLLLFACENTGKSGSDKTEDVAYLFAYFTGNGEGEEAIRYALSKDGYSYYALNNNEPIIGSKEISNTGGVRDPHILRGKDGSFRMVVTDLLTENGWSNTGMVLLKSDNLIDWKSTVINIPDTFQEFSNVTRVWAPQTYYDEEKEKYMVYFSMLQPGSYDKIYYAYANKDFTKLETTPKQLFYNPNEMASIDGDIIKNNGKYHLFYKTEGDEDKGIKVAVSDSLTSGYEPFEGNVDQTDEGVEGSGVFKLIDSDKYILMYDVYMQGSYQFTQSTDLKNFEVVDEQISMNFNPRHGSVIPITQEEAERLLEAFPSNKMPEGFKLDSGEQQKNRFDNPLVLQRADPFVTKADDGNYYFIATVPEYDRIEIRKSNTINGIKEAEPVVIWRKHEKGVMGNHIWAPELHRIDGKWYVYFAAGSAEEKWKIRMYALSNPSDDPTKGEWKEEGQIVSNKDDFSLDATSFEFKGQRYMIWTDRASDTIANTGLYIAKMTSPTSLADKQVVISQPTHEWEIQGHRVNEAPAVLIRNGKVFVTFSASATDANYAIGLLWADTDANLLDAASWHKLSEPVFYSNPKLDRYGPGHNSLTKSEDGETDVMIYHARNYKEIDGEPLYDPNRHTRARVIKWTKDGMPYFGQELGDNEISLEEVKNE